MWWCVTPDNVFHTTFLKKNSQWKIGHFGEKWLNKMVSTEWVSNANWFSLVRLIAPVKFVTLHIALHWVHCCSVHPLAFLSPLALDFRSCSVDMCKSKYSIAAECFDFMNSLQHFFAKRRYWSHEALIIRRLSRFVYAMLQAVLPWLHSSGQLGYQMIHCLLIVYLHTLGRFRGRQCYKAKEWQRILHVVSQYLSAQLMRIMTFCWLNSVCSSLLHCLFLYGCLWAIRELSSLIRSFADQYKIAFDFTSSSPASEPMKT